MSGEWKYPQDSLPADGDTVWVTRLPYFDKPFQCVWDGSGNVFTWTLPNSNIATIQPNFVWKWRPL